MATHLDSKSSRKRLMRGISWFLAISYFIGAPLTAFLEYKGQTFSERFDYPPELIYVTCTVQFICAMGVLIPRFAAVSAAALTVTTLGAIASHLKIGSPLTVLPALFYTAIQVWFGIIRFPKNQTKTFETKPFNKQDR